MARARGSCTVASASAPWTHTAACSAFPNVAGDAAYRNGVANLTANLRVRSPAGTQLATVVLMAGGGGGGLFSQLSNAEANVCTPLLAWGAKLVEVAWQEPQPLANTGGVFSGTQGPLALAVRSATLFRGIYDSLHTAGLPFVLVGQSGGSSQIAYALSHYGVGDFVDMAIVCSGPPHARLDYGMLGALKPSWAAQVSTYRTNASDTGDLGSGGRLFFDYSYGATQAGATFSGYQTQSVDGGALNLAFGDSVFNGAAETSFSQTDLRALYSNGDTGSPCVGRVWFGALSGASKSEYITTNNAAHVDVVGSTQGSDYIVQCVQAATLHH